MNSGVCMYGCVGLMLISGCICIINIIINYMLGDRHNYYYLYKDFHLSQL